AALHDLERGGNDVAMMGAFIVDCIVRAHLQTMERLNIGYDLLTYEGDILRLHFWSRAFEILKAQGAVFLRTEGRHAGCWVMRIDDSRRPDAADGPQHDGTQLSPSRSASPDHPGHGAVRQPADESDEEAREKVIVRSNGVVTYVGKDIANQLW